MKFIVAAAILFGLVHPGSKFILGQGIDLLSFCILYVLIRLLAQLPVAIKTRSYLVANKISWVYLVAIGIAGAGLQFTEFKGIANGLSVPIVTFLVYSHPLWSLLFSRTINREPLSVTSFVQLGFGLSGILLIAGSDLSKFNLAPQLFVAPLFAAMLIALWVSLSNKAKRLGCSSWTISFYYDLFAFLALVTLRLQSGMNAMPLSELLTWVIVPEHLFLMSIYSVLIGLVPNILFYHGNATTSARAAGLILLIEPLAATTVSHWIWRDQLSPYFFAGAGFVLLAGAPMADFKITKFKQI